MYSGLPHPTNRVTISVRKNTVEIRTILAGISLTGKSQRCNPVDPTNPNHASWTNHQLFAISFIHRRPAGHDFESYCSHFGTYHNIASNKAAFSRGVDRPGTRRTNEPLHPVTASARHDQTWHLYVRFPHVHGSVRRRVHPAKS